MIDDMKKARNSYSVAFMKFTQCKSLYDTNLFCFYEGEDAKYYSFRIANICNLSDECITSFNCGGKKEVKKLYEKISKNCVYKKVKKLFFVDRDYFPLEIDSTELFETPCYSVENFYTNISVFERVLKIGFGINVYDSDFEKCKELYKNRFFEFHESVLELNTWIKCVRKIEKENNLERLKIDFKISSHFEKINLEEVKPKYELNKKLLENLFPNAPIISDEEFSIIKSEFNNDDPQKCFRGKFELEFMKKMIVDLKKRNKKENFLTEKYECVKIDPNGDTLSILSQYADTPPELYAFLSRYRNIA